MDNVRAGSEERTPGLVVHGLPVSTSAHFPDGTSVNLRMIEPDEPVDLTPRFVVELFAVGLRIPEPDRTGWVQIAELDVDNDITFTVGATSIDNDLAIEAVRRGVELALATGLARGTPSQDHPSEEDSDASDTEP